MSNLEGTNFLAWIASNDPGEPVCLGGRDGGLSITAYYDDEDRITGVLVYDEIELIGAVGQIPAERFIEEVEFLNSV